MQTEISDSAFEQQVLNALSPKAELRHSAVAYLDNLVKTQPDAYALIAIRVANNSVQESVRHFSLVHLRQRLIDFPNDPSIVLLVSGDTFNAMKAQLCALFLNDNLDDKTNYHTAHCIGNMGSIVLQKDSNKWSDLISTVFSWTSHANPRIRSGALTIFSIIVPSNASIFVPHINTLVTIIGRALASTEVDQVKKNAIQTTSLILPVAGKKKAHIKPFKQLAPIMLATVTGYLEKGNYSMSVECIQQMMNIVIVRPSFFEDILQSLWMGMLHIVDTCNKMLASASAPSPSSTSSSISSPQSTALPESVRYQMLSLRNTALELVVSLLKPFAKQLKKESRFSSAFVEAVIALMMSFTEDENWTITDDDDDPNDTLDAGIAALDRFATAMDGVFVTSTIIPFVQRCLSSSQWKERFVGLLLMTSVVEGVSSTLTADKMQFLLSLTLAHINDPSTRVILAAVHALSTFCRDLKSAFTTTRTFVADALNAILSVISDIPIAPVGNGLTNTQPSFASPPASSPQLSAAAPTALPSVGQREDVKRCFTLIDIAVRAIQDIAETTPKTHLIPLLPQIVSVLGHLLTMEISEESALAAATATAAASSSSANAASLALSLSVRIIEAKKTIRNEAMQSLCCVIDTADDAMQPFFSSLAPFLMGIMAADTSTLQSEKDKKYQALATNAAAELMIAVGKEAAAPLLAPFTSAVLKLIDEIVKGKETLSQAANGSQIGSGSGGGDGGSSFTAQAIRTKQAVADESLDVINMMWVHLSSLLRGRFAPMLPLLIPPLLAEAQTDPSAEQRKFVDAALRGDNNTALLLETRHLRGISARKREEALSSKIGDRETALTLIASYADSMGPYFVPFIEETVRVACALLESETKEGTISIFPVDLCASAIMFCIRALSPQPPDSPFHPKALQKEAANEISAIPSTGSAASPASSSLPPLPPLPSVPSHLHPVSLFISASPLLFSALINAEDVSSEERSSITLSILTSLKAISCLLNPQSAQGAELESPWGSSSHVAQPLAMASPQSSSQAGLIECFAGSVANGFDLEKYAEMLRVVLVNVRSRRKALEEVVEQGDDEDVANGEEDDDAKVSLAHEDSVLRNISRIIVLLFSTFGGLFVPYFEKSILPVVLEMVTLPPRPNSITSEDTYFTITPQLLQQQLSSSSSTAAAQQTADEADRVTGLSILSRCIQYGGAQASQLIPRFAPIFLHYIDLAVDVVQREESTRRNACVGLAFCALNGSQGQFGAFCSEAVEKLMGVLEYPLSRERMKEIRLASARLVEEKQKKMGSTGPALLSHVEISAVLSMPSQQSGALFRYPFIQNDSCASDVQQEGKSDASEEELDLVDDQVLDEARNAHDNAVTALLRILQKHSSSLPNSEESAFRLKLTFFAHLPLLGDEEEAVTCHDTLCWFVEARDSLLFGGACPEREAIAKEISDALSSGTALSSLSKGVNQLAHLFKILCFVVDTDFVSQATNEKFKMMLPAIRKCLPSEVLSKLWIELDEERKKCLNAIFS
ncbi:putative importin-5 [Monocercomonoides exilis]|uniref:putative importin-5 n=1 Tax=Monocercomonoides exilis TaxID=2049356 RepID=UPI00355949E7|nr:putative importin-5 [Monocercomonoides exilis]|eukprot:MONOS_10476.1-p1 / transcript=MONOS_10476.1 / gene=MONOS_10476 / organism=Monocercomonoides_exilis_PA203 / gene_product=importin-5 / transcript_product=importin-5 / location=Mono_scaffold00478:18367-23121(+) / protein_length=1514 / sequence_SO=supercontig / SO=protein_coding / is_pseudo=false